MRRGPHGAPQEYRDARGPMMMHGVCSCNMSVCMSMPVYMSTHMLAWHVVTTCRCHISIGPYMSNHVWMGMSIRMSTCHTSIKDRCRARTHTHSTHAHTHTRTRARAHTHIRRYLYALVDTHRSRCTCRWCVQSVDGHSHTGCSYLGHGYTGHNHRGHNYIVAVPCRGMCSRSTVHTHGRISP